VCQIGNDTRGFGVQAMLGRHREAEARGTNGGQSAAGVGACCPSDLSCVSYRDAMVSIHAGRRRPADHRAYLRVLRMPANHACEIGRPSSLVASAQAQRAALAARGLTRPNRSLLRSTHGFQSAGSPASRSEAAGYNYHEERIVEREREEGLDATLLQRHQSREAQISGAVVTSW
jgi:hypothetical protein